MDFIFNGRSSKEFNLVVTKVRRYDTPERDIETIMVPGRDGALYIDNGSYGPRKIEIECYIKSDVSKYSRLIDGWLYRNFGINKLFFTDEADVFYEGMCINKISFEETFKFFNECKIVFECKPFKKSFSGENIISINSTNTTIFNSTEFDSNPLIKIYGSGHISLIINNNTIYLNDIIDYVLIDSDLKDCYKDTKLMNNNMNGEFPKLNTGINTISWLGNVSKVEIIPRWRWI